LTSCGRRKQQVEEIQKSTGIALLSFAHAHQQAANAAEVVTVGASRIQDRLAKVWAALLPVKREDMPNDNLWADLNSHQEPDGIVQSRLD
jgi:hypothetical protein